MPKRKQEGEPKEPDPEKLADQLADEENEDKSLVSSKEMKDLQERADKEREEENRNPEKINELKRGIDLTAEEYHKERARQAGLEENATETDVAIVERGIHVTQLEEDAKNEPDRDKKANIESRIALINADIWEMKNRRHAEIEKQKELEILAARKKYIAENFSTMERGTLTRQEIEEYWTPERVAEQKAKDTERIKEQERLWREKEKQKEEAEKNKPKSWFKRLFGG